MLCRAQRRGESDKIEALEIKIDAMMRKLKGRDNKNIPLNQMVAMQISNEGLASSSSIM